MSEEELIESIFNLHKRWVEEGLEISKDSAEECDTKGMLENFYRATLALKGLEAVFTIEVPEVTEYIRKKKEDIRTKDIPELAGKLAKCICKK